MESKFEIFRRKLHESFRHCLKVVFQRRLQILVQLSKRGRSLALRPQLLILGIEAETCLPKQGLRSAGALPEFTEVRMELVNSSTMIIDCGWIYDVEDSALRNDQTMAEALTFRSVDAGLVVTVKPWWVLTLVIAGYIANDIAT